MTDEADRTIDRRIGGARRAIGGMFFVNGAAYASWIARLPWLRAHLGLGDRALGMLLLTTAVGAVCAFVVAGRLCSRFGSRAITRVAATAMCSTVWFVPLAPTPAWTALVLFTFGASSGLMDIAMNAHGIEVERLARRPILSSLHGLFSLGALAGAGGGALASAAGLRPAVHLACVTVVLLVWVWRLGRKLLDRASADPEPAAPTGPAADAARPGLPGAAVAPVAAVRRRAPPARLLALGVIAFCSSVGEGAMADWSAIYLRDLLHTSEAVAALGYAAHSLAMLAGRFSGDAVTARLGAVRLVRGGGLIVGTGLAIGLATSTVPTMIFGIACVGIGLSGVVPTVFRAGARLPGIPAGTALATVATLSYAGFLVGPPLIGVISDAFTLRIGLAVVVILAFILAGLSRVVGEPRQ